MQPAYPSLAPSAARLDQAVDQLVRLIDADSTSGREAPGVDLAAAIATELGLHVTRQPVAPQRDNLLVGHPDPAVLLCTHLDTVPPFLPARRTDGVIHGRGACDAKGVAIAMLHALVLARHAAPGVAAACLLVVGEETDHAGARAAVALEQLRPRHVILGEPCGMLPAIGQKGLLKVRLETRGKSGHSAYPELGVSAVHRLVAALHDLLSTPLPADATLGETTVNVGEVRGGVAANVIAPSAEALVLVRCAAPVDAVLAALRDRVGAEVKVIELSRAEPLDFDTLGMAGLSGSHAIGPAVPFNTDASILSALGAPISLMGPGDMRTAHGEGEHLPIRELALGIERFAEVLVRLS
jgi:acetylornithine deacetylase